MEIITEHIHPFVQIHNYHPIRSQRKCEYYLLTGKPVKLYNYPATGIHDYCLSPNLIALNALDSQISLYNSNQYLIPDTPSLCKNILINDNFPITYSFQELHPKAHIFLQTALADYSGNITILSTPTDTKRWIEQNMPNNKYDECDRLYLEKYDRKEWDLEDSKFPLSNKMHKFDETKVEDYDNMTTHETEESDNDGIIWDIFI